MTTPEAIRRRQRDTNILLLLVLLLMIGAAAYQFAVVNPRNDDIQGALEANQQQISADLIHSCVVAGDPQRHAIIGILRDQIAQSKSANLEQFFPAVPPSQLRRLVQAANASRRARIEQLKAVPDCTERYG